MSTPPTTATRTRRLSCGIVDITDEQHPIPVSNYIVPESAVENRAGRFGCHQPQEQVYDTILAVTWFSGGLRLVDIANPYRPEEVDFLFRIQPTAIAPLKAMMSSTTAIGSSTST